MVWKGSLSGALALCLLMSATGCATRVQYIAVPPIKCEHPIIDPRTNAGLVEGLRDYWWAVEGCNAANGVSDQ